MEEGKNKAYLSALKDLKMLMKKKMIEDKLHKSQHKGMSKKEDDYEEEEKDEKKMSYDDDDDDYKKDFMKGRSNKGKELGAAIMIAVKAKTKKDKYAGKKGKNKKKA